MLQKKKKMTVEEHLSFLIRQYHFFYEMLPVDDYCGRGAKACVHSFYKADGCFVVLNAPVTGEMAFFIADAYVPDAKALCRKPIDVRTISPAVWKKYEKKSLFPRLLFWNKPGRVLSALAEAIETEAKAHGACCGIMMKEDMQ